MDDGSSVPADRSGLSPRTVSGLGYADHCGLFFLVLAVTGSVVGTGTLRPGFLRCGGYADADGCRHGDYQRFIAGVFAAFSQIWRDRTGFRLRYRNWSESAGAGMAAAL